MVAIQPNISLIPNKRDERAFRKTSLLGFIRFDGAIRFIVAPLVHRDSKRLLVVSIFSSLVGNVCMTLLGLKK